MRTKTTRTASALAALAVLLGGALLTGTTAHAGTTGSTGTTEASPGCPNVKQIGSTGLVRVKLRNGTYETVASVKQYVGCNKNYGRVWVWEKYKSTPKDLYVAVQARRDKGFETETENKAGGTAGEKTRDLWTPGAGTASSCSRVLGKVGIYGTDDNPVAYTDVRC